MKMFRAVFSFLFVFLYSETLKSQDSTSIKVLFLYGSKPKKEFKDEEYKWFGGRLGGHVGICTDSNTVVSILPYGKFHVFGSKRKIHSKFVNTTQQEFWSILGHVDSVKKLIVEIPVSYKQKTKLDSLHTTYLQKPPYDYAFFGMRCGAATYEILAQLKLLKRYSRSKVSMKIFYPKKLRRRILKKAEQKNWTLKRQEGSTKRKWEKD